MNQELLIETQDRYRALMDNTLLGVAVMDTNHRILEVNKTFSKMFNKPVNEFVGKFCFDEFEKRDEICPHCPGSKALASGDTFEVVTQGVRDDGSGFYVWNRAFPIYNHDGEIKGFIEIVEDITKQKTAEKNLKKAYEDLNRLQSRLIQSEKMASIGQLASGIAHEINNPTTFIETNLHTLSQYLHDILALLGKYTELVESLRGDESSNFHKTCNDINQIQDEISLDYVLDDMQNTIDDSIEGVRRISKIVQSLQSFSDMNETECANVDINSEIESLLTIVNNDFGDDICVKKELSPLPKITCYPQQINQVIVNLLINACQAIKGKGTIKLHSFYNDDNIYIQISDTGEGIKAEHLNKIFDPFFTTREIGSGTGLGLTIAYNIIKNHNGNILVKSIPGKGTIFSVVFPVIQKPKQPEVSPSQ